MRPTYTTMSPHVVNWYSHYDRRSMGNTSSLAEATQVLLTRASCTARCRSAADLRNGRHPWPVVFIHGAARTGTGWITTPNGRRGWVPWFAERGWEVRVGDQTARGHSAWQPSLDGSLKPVPVRLIETLFAASKYNLGRPQAKRHTQWSAPPTWNVLVIDLRPVLCESSHVD